MPSLKRQRCKQRTLPDGTIENYDCVYEYQGDLGENYDIGWDGAAETKLIGRNDPVISTSLSPISCSSYQSDINIRPLTFYNSYGTLVTKLLQQGLHQ
ncbi:MAG: hypothetical protein CM15mV28_1640 [Thaumasvirus sp.]|nr:MAG: hypothetical protein CM15mV28_1640 [Thaumasvirus sp.]